MNLFKDKKKKKIFLSVTIPVMIFAIIFTACAVYLGDYYHSEVSAFADASVSENVSREILEDGTIIYKPDEIKAGFIFYPGGKVEYTSYAPLMKACAEKGIMCVVLIITPLKTTTAPLIYLIL